jgi:hypothetical protein
MKRGHGLRIVVERAASPSPIAIYSHHHQLETRARARAMLMLHALWIKTRIHPEYKIDLDKNRIGSRWIEVAHPGIGL